MADQHTHTPARRPQHGRATALRTPPSVTLCYVVVLALALAALPGAAAQITGISPVTAVRAQPRVITFTGTGVAAGDRAFWQLGRNDCDLFPANEGGELVVSASLSVTTTFLTVSPESNNYTLCYSFAGAPYERYPEHTITVLGVTGLSQTHFVVDQSSTFFFEGYGVGNGDTAKFVSKSALSCDDATDAGLYGTAVAGEVLTVSRLGNAVAFGSQPARLDGALVLCYAFQGEAFAFYTDVEIKVSHIASQRATGTGANHVVVVGQPKSFTFGGSGISPGDRVKFIASTATKDSHCWTLPTSGDLTDGGAAGTPVGEGGVATLKPLETSPKAGAWRLCYKFGDRPFKLYTTIQTLSKGVYDTDTAAVIVGTTNVITVSGLHFSRTDRAKWVPAGSSCDAVPDAAAAGGSVAVDPFFNYETPRLTRNFASDQHALCTWSFSHSGTGWQLCYKFDEERYQRFDAVTIAGLEPKVSAVSHSISVVGQNQTYELRGTVGITAVERMKFVENIAADCTGKGLPISGWKVDAEDNSVLVVGETNPAVGAASGVDVSKLSLTGAATAHIAFTTPSPDYLPWRLCYKFGDAPYMLFPAVSMAVKGLTSIHVTGSASGSGIIIGDSTSVVFAGSGVHDGDRAKWIANAVDDEDCLGAATGGSSSAEIKERTASFTFSSAVDRLHLCYKFGDEPFKLYSNIPVVLDSQVIPGPQLDLELASVRIRLLMNIETIRAGTAARATFNNTLRADLATALSVPESRIVISRMVEGPSSVYATARLFPSNNPADASVRQLVQGLQVMQERRTSALYDGAVTKDVDPRAGAVTAEYDVAVLADVPGWEAVSAATLAALTDDQQGDVVPLTVRAYQSAGLFQFTSAEVRAAEGTDVTLTVTRLHGSRGRIALRATTADETATVSGGDYSAYGGIIAFADGQTEQTLALSLPEDDVAESHFETFQVSIAFHGGEHGAALGTLPTTLVRVYDWAQGTRSADATFSISAGAHASSDPAAPAGEFKGWSVTGNGDSAAGALMLDVNGVFAADRVYEGSDYNSRCDFAAPKAPCDHSCAFGQPYQTSLGSATGVLALTGVGSIVSEGLSDFPDVELSVSMWVRVQPAHASTTATLLSYAVHEPAHATNPLARDFMEVMLSDTKDLRLMVHGRVVNTRRGLRTGVTIADGEWHFVAVTWRSSDGSVYVHDNGRVVCDTGPYKTGHKLMPGGTLVVGGQQLRLGCRPGEGLGPNGAPCAWSGSLEAGRGFVGSMQNLRLWNYVLTPAEVGHGMVWPFERSRVGLILYWRFDPSHVTTNDAEVNKYSGAVVQDLGTGGNAHAGVFSAAGASVTAGSPSTHPNFPCGQVHTNIWYFSAASPFLGNQELAYNGRLQFRLMAPSHAGAPRNPRGSVVLTGGPEGGGMTLSYALAGFAEPGPDGWSRYSVVLREDNGWVHEPSNVTPTGAELVAVLRRVTGLYIRGDAWLYGAAGSGQEVVYLNDVTLVNGLV